MALYNVANAAGAAVRAAMNTIFGKLQQNYYGATDPATNGDSTPGMFWVDTGGANNLLKIRNSADTAWITVGTIGSSFEPAGTTSFSRSLLDDTTAAQARATLGGALIQSDLTRGFEFIAKRTAPGDNLEFDSADFDSSKYDNYQFVADGVAGSGLRVRMSTNGGSTWISTNAYKWAYFFNTSSAATPTGQISNGAVAQIDVNLAFSDYSCVFELLGAHNAGTKTVLTFNGSADFATPVVLAPFMGSGHYIADTAVNGIQFLTGGLVAPSLGSITMFGRRKTV